MRGEHTPDELPSDDNKRGNKGTTQGVAEINRNRWPTSIGISGRLGAESALDAINDNPQILKEGSNPFLAERLSGLLPIEAERVYQVCSALLDQRKDKIGNIASGFSLHGDELIDISLTLQRISTHRAKGLELFERLLDLDAYGIQNTLFELDRRPSRDGVPVRQRRRRKKS